jgi:hypothetical protein
LPTLIGITITELWGEGLGRNAVSKDRVWAEAKARTVKISGKQGLFEISKEKDKAILKPFRTAQGE